MIVTTNNQLRQRRNPGLTETTIMLKQATYFVNAKRITKFA